MSQDYLTSDYVSGAVTIQGLGNGTDFSQTIAKLKQIEEIPAKRLLKWKADWQDRQEAFRIVRQQLVSLREIAVTMNSMDKFLAKAASSSKPDTATATATSTAQEGVYKLETGQLATSAIWSVDTGFANLSDKVNTGSAATSFTYQYGGKTRTLSIAAGTTLEGLKNLINNDAQNPGVRVSLVRGADGYTFQMRGMDLGSAHELHITYADLSGFPPKSGYAGYSVTMNTGLDAATGAVNASGKIQTFSFTANGKTYDISLANNATLQDLVGKINAATGTHGVTAGVVTGSDGKQALKLEGGEGVAVTVPENTDSGLIEGLRKASDPFKAQSSYNATINTGLSTPQAMVNTSGGVKTFEITHGGWVIPYLVPHDSTLSDFVELINAQTESTQVRASLSKGADGNQVLTLSSLDGKEIEVTGADPAMTGITAAPAYSAPTAGGWYVQQSQDAKIRVNGWPAGSWLTVPSNTVDEVVEGLSFTLKEVGGTTLTVATDTEKIKENVLSFIEAVNSFRATILELTKLDSSKSTVDPKYATSLYDMQKGSILTGNYGVQLLSSQVKQATAGMPLGFMPMTDIDGFLAGDMYTSLSQLGIKTEASGSGGMNFGLLVLNTDPDLPTLDDVLAKNPMAVAEFFAASNKGVSDSSNFSFGSQVSSVTKPGAYTVSYDVDDQGNIVNATINGKKAKYYPDTGEIGIVREGPGSSNDSKVTASSDGTVEGEYSVDVLALAEGAKMSFDTGIDGGKSGVLAPSSSDTAVATSTVDGTVGSHTVDVIQLAKSAGIDIAAGLNAATDELSATEEHITFDIGANAIDLTINAGETLEAFVARVNGDAGSAVKATAVESGGVWNLRLATRETGADVQILNLASPVGAASAVDGQDAKYTIDGGAEQTSKTNTIANPAPGITRLTLQGTGPATITTGSTTPPQFKFKTGGVEYTIDVKPDETLDQLAKRINANGAIPIKLSADSSGGTWKLTMQTKATGSDVAISGFTTTIGALQTPDAPENGKDAQYKVNGGAVKTSKTNTIANAVTGLTLTLKGVTDAGSPVTIRSQKDNDADGITVHVDNLTEGSYSGTVRIKQGKINELLRLLDGPPNKPEEGMLGSKGALQILQDNYDDIIAGIDAKVEREDARITKWERLMKLRFARLDATLKQYDSLSKSIESQIKTLSSGSSS